MWEERRREEFDKQEYEKECVQEAKRLKANPTKVVYCYTHAYRMPDVYDKKFVDENPEPFDHPFRPSINDDKEEWDAYKERVDAKEKWDREGGSIQLWCPAIIKANLDHLETCTVFLDLAHVHGGWYDRIAADFTFEAYPRKDGKPHCIVLEDEPLNLGSYLNITKDWDKFKPDEQYAVLKHTKAIGEAACGAHSNRPDATVKMVHDVRLATCDMDGEACRV